MAACVLCEFTCLQMAGHHCQHTSLRLAFQLGRRPRDPVCLTKDSETLQKHPTSPLAFKKNEPDWSSRLDGRRSSVWEVFILCLLSSVLWLYLMLIGGPPVGTACRRVGQRRSRRNGARDVYSLADVGQVRVALPIGPVACSEEGQHRLPLALASYLTCWGSLVNGCACLWRRICRHICCPG